MVNSFSLIKKMVQTRQGKGGGGGGSYNYFYTPPQSYFENIFNPIKKDLLDNETLTIERLEMHINKLKEEVNFKRYGYGKLSNKENQQRLTYLAFARRTVAKMYEKQSGEEYLQALELDNKDPIALEYMGELFIQMNKLEKIDEEKVIERLKENGSENELKLLEDALCVWKNETDVSLRSFRKFDLSCPEPFINLFITQSSNDDKWSLSRVIIDINGSQRTPKTDSIYEVNKIGKSKVQIPIEYFTTGKNTIRISNWSGVEGRVKDNGDGNTWDLYEIALEDNLGNNLPLTNLTQRESWGYLLNLIDGNTNSYWSYDSSKFDLTETNGKDVSETQWVQFEVVLK